MAPNNHDGTETAGKETGAGNITPSPPERLHLTPHQPLEQRILDYDAKVGPRLEEKGYAAVSPVEHERLRGLLLEAGYEVLYQEKVKPSRHYPLNSRNVYSRPCDGGVEVFLERKVVSGKEKEREEQYNGFSYLKFSSLNDVDQFQKYYRQWAESRFGALNYIQAGAGAGWMIGSAYLLFPIIDFIFLPVAVMGLLGGIIPAFEAPGIKRAKGLANILKYKASISLDRQAICQAFHVTDIIAQQISAAGPEGKSSEAHPPNILMEAVD